MEGKGIKEYFLRIETTQKYKGYSYGVILCKIAVNAIRCYKMSCIKNIFLSIFLLKTFKFCFVYRVLNAVFSATLAARMDAGGSFMVSFHYYGISPLISNWKIRYFTFEMSIYRYNFLSGYAVFVKSPSFYP